MKNFLGKKTEPEPVTEKTPWIIGAEILFGEKIPCSKCGGKTRLIPSAPEWDIESWECLNESCKSVMECRVKYIKQKFTVAGTELKPVSCILEKVW
ncbi:MAG: hypothetical protein NTU69_08000 [Proteobacteria bacterium]|nr:hypothetical protein [Pseudomonadota bacterium]